MEAIRHQDRGLPAAHGRTGREGWHLHQYAAAAAVSRQGRRSARRLAVGPVARLSPRANAQGALWGFDPAARSGATPSPPGLPPVATRPTVADQPRALRPEPPPQEQTR